MNKSRKKYLMIHTTSIGEIFALVDNVNSDDDDNIEKF